MRRGIKPLVLVLGLAAMAAFVLEVGHNFVSFGARSKRAEPKTDLRRLCLAQRALLSAGRPSSTFRGLSTEVDRGNCYAYFIAPGGALELRPDDHRPVQPNLEAAGLQVDPRMGPKVAVSEADVPSVLLGEVKLGANGECPRCTWVLVAVGSIDVDPELDVLSAATEPRVAPSGETIDVCVPFLERDDLPPSPVRRLFR